MVEVSSRFAFLVFVGEVWVVWVIFYGIAGPEPQSVMKRMGFVGAIGGILVSQWYRQDFWHPLSVLSFQWGPIFFSIEDMLFGALFCGIPPTLLFLFLKRSTLDPLSIYQRRGLLMRFLAPAAVVLFGGFCLRILHWNSVAASALGLCTGAAVIAFIRRDLLWMMLGGSMTTLILFALLVKGFTACLGNAEDLAWEVCLYCRESWSLLFPLVLVPWAISFGAFFSVVYPFMTNHRISVR